jgi:hypothetical protein
VVGIYSADGAYDIYKVVLKKADELGKYWTKQTTHETRTGTLARCGDGIASLNGVVARDCTVGGGACGNEVRDIRFDCLNCERVFCETCGREAERRQKQLRDKKLAALAKAAKAAGKSAAEADKRRECDQVQGDLEDGQEHKFVRVARVLDENLFPPTVVTLSRNAGKAGKSNDETQDQGLGRLQEPSHADITTTTLSATTPAYAPN